MMSDEMRGSAVVKIPVPETLIKVTPVIIVIIQNDSSAVFPSWTVLASFGGSASLVLLSGAVVVVVVVVVVITVVVTVTIAVENRFPACRQIFTCGWREKKARNHAKELVLEV